MSKLDVVKAGDDVSKKKPDPMIYNMAQVTQYTLTVCLSHTTLITLILSSDPMIYNMTQLIEYNASLHSMTTMIAYLSLF